MNITKPFWRWFNRKRFEEEVSHLAGALSDPNGPRHIPVRPPRGYNLGDIVGEVERQRKATSEPRG